MMYYVYVLKSDVNGDIYIGYSTDLRERYKSHNEGKVRSTKAYKPWKLVYYEAYKGKADATRREKRLKEHNKKDELRLQLEFSLKI